jgi:hypothetical protein
MPMDRGLKRLAVTNECVADGPKEAMQIWVMTTRGRKITLDVKADGSDTIENIKAQIETKEHTPVTKQTLWFEERMLNNNWNLSFCGIQEEAILVLSEKGVIMHVRLTIAEKHTILSVDTHDPMIVVMQKLQDITSIPIGRIALEVHEEKWPAALQPSVPLNRGA